MDPEENGIHPVRSALIVEDEPADQAVSDLKKALVEQGWYVRSDPFDPMKFESFAAAGQMADIAILDWKLTEDEGRLATALLKDLLDGGVVGVAVFTRVDPGGVENTLRKERMPVGDRLKVFSKSKGIEPLLEFIAGLAGGPKHSLGVALGFRSLFRWAIGKTISEVCKWDENLLMVLCLGFAADELDYAIALSEYLTGLLQDEIMAGVDEQLPPDLRELLETLKSEACASSKVPRTDRIERFMEPWRQLRHDRMYDRTKPSTSKVHLGDIRKGKGEGEYMLVVSPRCEVVRSRTGTQVSVLCGKIISSEGDKNRFLDAKRALRYVILPDMPIGQDSVAHAIFWLSKASTYDADEVLKWEWVARVRAPYIDEIVQAFAKFFLRVGTPSDPWQDDDEWKQVMSQWLNNPFRPRAWT